MTNADISVDKSSEISDNESVIAKDDYAKLLGQTIRAMEDRVAGMRSQRELLASQLRELDDQIAVAQQDVETAKTIWNRTPFSGAEVGDPKPLAGMGMTEAIRYVLSRLMLRMTPTEVRDKMAEWGYDFSKYETDVVSSIHTVLKRFAAKGDAKEFDEGRRRKSYKWSSESNTQTA